jgi:N-acetylneuraminic acid mutarotase/tetratricopeptide (TPR) repeat protein
LRRFLDDKTIQARRPTLRHQVMKWARRHKPVVWSALTVLAITLTLLAGVVGWAVRDRETRQAEIDRQREATQQAVAEMLTEAAALQEKQQWENVRRLLERAKGRLEGSGLRPLQDQVAKRLHEISMVAQLEEAHKLAPLVVANKPSGKRLDRNEADIRYRKIFAELGVRMGDADFEAAARRVRETSIRVQMVTALEYWAIVNDGPGGTGAEMMRAIAALADDDSWRHELRAAKDVAALERLARRKDVFEQSPTNLILLYHRLGRPPAKRASADPKLFELAEDLLRQAGLRYPRDFWINYTLAIRALAAKRNADAIGYFRSALAAEPRHDLIYRELGACLASEGRLVEAAEAYQFAIRLDPDNVWTYREIAGVYEKMNKLAEAEAAYRKILELCPIDAKVSAQLVQVMLKRGKLFEAVRAFLDEPLAVVEWLAPDDIDVANPPVTWRRAAPMAMARDNHTATRLTDGKVLVAGGFCRFFGGALASAELYDPVSDQWTAAPSMRERRAAPTATRLADGRVLVTGGYDKEGDAFFRGQKLSSAEVYDPARNTWTAAAPMSGARSFHTATLLKTGHVLVLGGPAATAELYDPAANAWTPTGALPSPVGLRHAATFLHDGKVLVTGGSLDGAGLTQAAIYDPATNAWSSADAMARPRSRHTATLLGNGMVLVVGGYTNEVNPQFPARSSAELYDPVRNQWSPAAPLLAARSSHTATRLDNGKVLVTGGMGNSNPSRPPYQSLTEIYDPASNTWSSAGGMNVVRTFFTATLLDGGRVLVAGGLSGNDRLGFVYEASAELYP